MRLATTRARVICAATTTVAYRIVFPTACTKTGSAARVSKFASPMNSPPVTRAFWSDNTSPWTTGSSVNTTNSENVGRTKMYDQPYRRSTAAKLRCRRGAAVAIISTAACAKRTRQADERCRAARLFVGFVQQLLRLRRHLVECLLGRLLALERRVTRRPQVLLVDLGPRAYVRQHVGEGAHRGDLRLCRVIVAVDACRGLSACGGEPVLDRRRLLFEVRSDVRPGEVFRERVRRGLLVGV